MLALVSDLDHTMVQNEDPSHKHLLAFNHAWTTTLQAVPQGQPRPLLVLSTGRSPTLLRHLWEEAPLLTPDVLICSVGTEVFYNTCSPTVRLLLAQAGQQQGQPQGLGLGLEEEAGQEAGPGAGPTSTAAADTAPAAEEACEAARQRACFQPDRAWEAKLEEGWDVERVRALVAHHFPHLAKQRDSEQRPHKVSFTLDPQPLAAAPPATSPDAPPPGAVTAPGSAASAGAGAAAGAQQSPAEALMQRLRRQLQAEGLRAKVIYSGGRDVDVISAGAGKGCALAFLLERLRAAGVGPSVVQVNGDSGNDAELFEVPGVVGCVVANAHPELVAFADAATAREGGASHIFRATEPCAGGILQAMRYFGLLPTHVPPLAVEPPGVGDTLGMQLDSGAPEQISGSHAGMATSRATAAGTAAGPGPQPGSGTSWEAAVWAARQRAVHGSPEQRQQEQQVALREFAWRLGAALMEAVVDGVTAPEDLVYHSSLRLMVTNEAQLRVVGRGQAGAQGSGHAHSAGQQHLGSGPGGGIHPSKGPGGPGGAPVHPGASTSPSAAGPGSVPSVAAAAGGSGASAAATTSVVSAGALDAEGWELVSELQAVPVAEAAAAQVSPARVWVDEVEVVPVVSSSGASAGVGASGGGGAGEDEAAAGEQAAGVNMQEAQEQQHWLLRFKAYGLTSQGLRSEGLACGAVVTRQDSPVPHGFLASELCVTVLMPPQQLEPVLPGATME